jgi:hypothetical protein
MSARDVERTQRLLRRLDVMEVLEDLDLEIVRRNGADVYCLCPDPSHVESNPSFHICVEDITDSEGRERLGWFHCWSHPNEPLKGVNFLDLVARIRGNIWDRWPTGAERVEAGTWLRTEYIRGNGEEGDASLEMALKRRERLVRVEEKAELVWPPNVPIERARPEFLRYLLKRDISLERAKELDLRAVSSAGDVPCLLRTVPGILFPIKEGGKVVNWYVRSIFRVPSRVKGRYCPGIPFVKDAGIVWVTGGEVDLSKPVALVEGIYDAERVRTILLEHPGVSPIPAGNVLAVLGGRVYPNQARRIRGLPFLIHLADGDEGGRSLWRTVEEHLSNWTRPTFRPLPEGMDPGDAPVDLILEALRAPEERRFVELRFRSTGRRAR